MIARNGALALLDLWERYFTAHDRSPDTRRSYRYAVNDFTRWLSRAATVLDLVARFDEYIRDRSERGSKYTTHGHRSRLRAMLAWAEREGLATMPKRIRTVRCPPIVPVGFTNADWGKLLKHAPSVAQGGLIRVGLMIAYDSGLRRGDLLLRVLWSQLGSDGRLVVVTNKPGRIHIPRLRPETIAAANLIRVDADDRMIPWPFGLDVWNRRIRAVRKLAGVPAGATQQVRRTGASHVLRVGGNPSHYLGHSPKSGESLSWRFYLDPLIVGDVAPLPPPMGE
jgi:hypothetical protein